MLIFSMNENVFARSGDKAPPPKFPSKVRFAENKNQWENFIRYEAAFRGGKIFLENNRFTYLFYHPDDMQSLHPHEGKQIDKIRLHAVRIHAAGGNEHPEIKPDDAANYFNNYFIGNDSSKWASDVKLFSSVTYQNLYTNIDLKFYSSVTDIKYDLIVKPGGDASTVSMEYEGVDDLSIKDGALTMKLSVGTIIEEKPYSYQLIDGKETEVRCKFFLHKNKLSFRFPDGYNKSLPLIIDPTLIFSSYTGSTADNWGFTATYDAAGNVYSGGNINSIGYPATPGAYQVTYGGGGAGGNGWDCDMAIAKFNATGTALLYATYLGGSDNEQPQSLVVDGNDNLLIFGTSFSSNYPTTAGAYQGSLGGGGDIVISKLSTNGNTLLASTFIGGSANDGLNTDPGFVTTGPLKYNYSDEARGEIIADANNNYLVGSCTQSPNFPTTAGVLQPAFGGGNQDGIVFKINSSLTSLVWSTFIGGSSDDAVYDCVIDNSGNIFLAGGTASINFPTTPGVLHETFQGGVADGFIAHINNGGNFIMASTFIGTPSYDQTYFVELDNSGNVYTTGQTEGAYPVTPGVYANPGSKQFIHKMNEGLSSTFYSTVFGNGSTFPNISPTAFLVDTCENVYVAGWGRCLSLGAFTNGNVLGMPITSNAYQSTTDGCDFYFFVLNHDANSVLYATYFGGNISQEHVDGGTSRFNKNGTIYEAVCAGCGGHSDFPTTPGVVSNTNNANNCNNGVIKLEFNLAHTVSSITAPLSYGCLPLVVAFTNNSINADSYEWDFGDGTPLDTFATPTHVFADTGVFHIRLVAINHSSCNVNDTSYAVIEVKAPLPITAAFHLSQNPPCDTTASVQSVGSGGNDYTWNFGDGFTTGGLTATHTYADTGTYTITLIVRDTFCIGLADTTSLPAPFHSAARASVAVSGAVNGCAPFPVTFNNHSSTHGNHFWNFGDGNAADTTTSPTHIFVTAGTYDVIYVINDPYSCNGTDTAHVLITVPPSTPLNASFNVVKSPDCDTLSATVNFDGTGGNIYRWDFGDGQHGSGLNLVHIYSVPGTYNITLVAADSVCNRLDTAIKSITFRQSVSAGVNTHNVLFGCVPQAIELSNRFASTGTGTWYLGDGTIATGPVVHHTYNRIGTYVIELIISDTTSCNLGDTGTYTLNVYPNPVAGFVHDQEIFYFLNNDIHFYDRSSDAAYFNWDFGDGTFASDSIVAHQFRSGGTFDICLRVTSNNGCIDSTCAPLDINTSEMIYVPNVFTPNGDGRNDDFRVYSTGLTELDVMIFNRWGEIIYEYNTLSGSWDGKYNGKPVAEDVYVWKLKAKGLVNDDIIRYGRVSVVK